MPSTTGDKQNQLLYREVNLRIREVSDSVGSDANLEFLCECGRSECTETFELTQAQFDELVNGGRLHLLVPGHKGSLIGQRVIAEHADFLVVVDEPPSGSTT